MKHVVELQLYLECLLTESLPVAELGVTDQAVLVPILIKRKLDTIHSKSEKVCGTAFSVKKNCGKSA